ncbi:MAG: type II toxin-antitoxin system RelE/ParE family toxin [Clostridia bacterium]|nr:type II toxin-antitoxin system RelE/ParE family toxin [Clostridia bacterium]
MFEIEFYEDKNGNSEIINYIHELDKETNNKDDRIKLKKITQYIEMLEEEGFELREPHIKHLYKEIWELRPLKDRILFASLYENKIILLSVFRKETKKTLVREILKARKLLKDFKERRNIN